ncbi:MAG: hypothetical protein SVM79_10540 [Chloroflexota bacterium]|nr:hypothetical protein [Chloroflexota bacterium]
MLTAKSMKRIIRWLLLIGIIVYVFTGFGITEYRTVESLTFGLLTKNLSHRIHTAIEIPFLILLLLHIFLSSLLRVRARLTHRQNS